LLSVGASPQLAGSTDSDFGWSSLSQISNSIPLKQNTLHFINSIKFSNCSELANVTFTIVTYSIFSSSRNFYNLLGQLPTTFQVLARCAMFTQNSRHLLPINGNWHIHKCAGHELHEHGGLPVLDAGG
jgi:hypothetical protein